MVSNVTISKRFQGYVDDWDYKTYLSFGGYGSGKSYSTVVKIVLKLMQEKRTALVVRNVFETIKESCFSLFKEVIESMGMLSDITSMRSGKKSDGKIIVVQSPMEIRFPNGSRVIFKGMDNPEKIKSINNVSIVWVEECSEITQAAYMELLGRVRSSQHTIHFILTTNPVGKWNWVYNMFFVRTDEEGNETIIQDENEVYRRRTLVNTSNGVYYHHSTVDDNPFLGLQYKETLEEYKHIDLQMWLVARWGRFGTGGLRVLPNFCIAQNAKQFKNKVNSIGADYHFFGLDFGFEESFNALISCCVDDTNKDLYIYDEIYVNHITDDRFSHREDVRNVMQRAERCGKPIVCDSSEPKSIQYYRQEGFNMYACKKYAGRKLQDIKKMKRFRHIYCSPKCKNTIRELKDLTYAKDKQGTMKQDEFTIDSHTMDAIRYSLEHYMVADVKELKTNSYSG